MGRNESCVETILNDGFVHLVQREGGSSLGLLATIAASEYGQRLEDYRQNSDVSVMFGEAGPGDLSQDELKAYAAYLSVGMLDLVKLEELKPVTAFESMWNLQGVAAPAGCDVEIKM